MFSQNGTAFVAEKEGFESRESLGKYYKIGVCNVTFWEKSSKVIILKQVVLLSDLHAETEGTGSAISGSTFLQHTGICLLRLHIYLQKVTRFLNNISFVVGIHYLLKQFL